MINKNYETEELEGFNYSLVYEDKVNTNQESKSRNNTSDDSSNKVRKARVTHLNKDSIRKITVKHLDDNIVQNIKINKKPSDEKLKKKYNYHYLELNELSENLFPKKHVKEDKRKFSKNDPNKKEDTPAINFLSIGLNGQHNYEKTKFNLNMIAKHIRTTKKIKYYLGSLLYYKPPIYKRISDHECKTLIRKTLPESIESQLTDFQLSEMVKLIKTDPESELKEEDIKTEKWIIPFENKLFNLETNEIMKASDKYYFFSCINADYDHENIGFGYTFEDYLSNCTGNNKDLRKLILEVIGYILSNSMAAKKMFILYGVPDSGKSTFGEFIQNLIGIENCCHIQLQDLSKRFMVAELYGKKLCLNMDISDSPIRDTSIIKQLTGNDLLSAERKGEHPFSFKNHCKLLYGCNNLPKVTNGINEQAFYKRLIIIPFLNSISPDNQDKDLLNKLLKEKNYIIHKALKAFKRLVNNNYQFTTCEISESILNEHIQQSNNVLEFVRDRCYIHYDASVYSSTLYNNYRNYCYELGYSEEDIFNINMFSRAISRIYGVKNHRWRDGEINLRGFKGIKVKEYD